MEEETNKIEALFWRSPQTQLGLDLMLFTMMIPLGLSLVMKSSDSLTFKFLFGVILIALLVKLAVFFYFLIKNIFQCPYWLSSLAMIGPATECFIFDYVGRGIAALYLILNPVLSYACSKFLYLRYKNVVVGVISGDRH